MAASRDSVSCAGSLLGCVSQAVSSVFLQFGACSVLGTENIVCDPSLLGAAASPSAGVATDGGNVEEDILAASDGPPAPQQLIGSLGCTGPVAAKVLMSSHPGRARLAAMGSLASVHASAAAIAHYSTQAVGVLTHALSLLPVSSEAAPPQSPSGGADPSLPSHVLLAQEADLLGLRAREYAGIADLAREHLAMLASQGFPKLVSMPTLPKLDLETSMKLVHSVPSAQRTAQLLHSLTELPDAPPSILAAARRVWQKPLRVLCASPSRDPTCPSFNVFSAKDEVGSALVFTLVVCARVLRVLEPCDTTCPQSGSGLAPLAESDESCGYSPQNSVLASPEAAVRVLDASGGCLHPPSEVPSLSPQQGEEPEYFPVTAGRFDRFVAAAYTISEFYRKNPYHCEIHAADVTQYVTYFMSTLLYGHCGVFSQDLFSVPGAEPPAADPASFPLRTDPRPKVPLTPEDKDRLFALLCAAAIHDIDHPALENTFMVKAHSDLTYLYNDASVLESHHAAFGCALLSVSHVFDDEPAPADAPEAASEEDEESGTDVSECMEPVGPSPTFVRIRPLIAKLVLTTDLSKQLDFLTRLRATGLSARASETPSAPAASPFTPPSVTSETVLMLAIKLADVANQARPEQLSTAWAKRIMREFYAQGDLERIADPAINSFHDRHDPTSLPDCQRTFIQYIVRPLFEGAVGALSHSLTPKELFGPLHRAVDRDYRALVANAARWSERFHAVEAVKKQLHATRQALGGNASVPLSLSSPVEAAAVRAMRAAAEGALDKSGALALLAQAARSQDSRPTHSHRRSMSLTPPHAANQVSDSTAPPVTVAPVRELPRLSLPTNRRRHSVASFHRLQPSLRVSTPALPTSARVPKRDVGIRADSDTANAVLAALAASPLLPAISRCKASGKNASAPLVAQVQTSPEEE
jgi:hypothetical protein